MAAKGVSLSNDIVVYVAKRSKLVYGNNLIVY